MANDSLDEDYKLIDEGRYSEAIQDLQALSLEDFRPAVKVALASAYAARGGIRAENYLGFVIGFAAPIVSPENVQENNLKSSSFQSLQKIVKQAKGSEGDLRELQALEDVLEASTVWDRYKGRLDAIPAVKGEALKDLRLAVDTLASVQTPGGRLYRAILNLILFKSFVVASGSFWSDFNKAIEQLLRGETQVLCHFNFDELLQWLEPISYHLTETLGDLTLAFPENRKDFESSQGLIQGIYITTKNAVDDLRKKRTCL